MGYPLSIFVITSMLLATATIAVSYVIQPADALCGDVNQPYGQGCILVSVNPNSNAQNGVGSSTFGGAISGLAQGSGIQGILH